MFVNRSVQAKGKVKVWVSGDGLSAMGPSL